MLQLQRAYTSRYGTPTIDRVDPRIFVLTWHGQCMECHYCHDLCCQYGTTVDADEVARIQARADELEPYLGVARGEWFHDRYVPDADYPAGRTTRSQVRQGLCVFIHRHGRGCMLHRFALERGLDVHAIKPMTCMMFPIYWAQGALFPNEELTDGSLVCLGPGATVYRGARAEVEYYFGPELVAELDALEARTPAAQAADVKKTSTIPLELVETKVC